MNDILENKFIPGSKILLNILSIFPISGKSIILPSKLYKLKFVSNISESGRHNNDIDETLTSMVKSVSNSTILKYLFNLRRSQ